MHFYINTYDMFNIGLILVRIPIEESIFEFGSCSGRIFLNRLRGSGGLKPALI